MKHFDYLSFMLGVYTYMLIYSIVLLIQWSKQNKDFKKRIKEIDDKYNKEIEDIKKKEV